MYGDGKLKLRALIGEYPKTQALREARIASDIIELDIADIAQAPKGFKPLVRELAFDVAEVSIITFLQAKAAGKPYALLPYVVNGKFHHDSLLVSTNAGIETPKDLEGKRIGMRMYSQTTPTWVRGFLQNDYGVDLSTIEWVTFEEPHVQEFPDPPGVVRGEKGKQLFDMLVGGELHAAFISGAPEDPRVRKLLADPASAAADWSRTHHGAVPINHMLAVRQELLDERPDAVREFFRLLHDARMAMDPAPTTAMLDREPYGVDKVRTAVDLANLYAVQQGLIPRAYSVDELFDEFTASLGNDKR
ncbi:ABC transporter substrate-binding protein [Sphingobium boeckii]|uniref:4,5-dihydroxyphthalate decarboxylase n=1 Tax=Sphingobium boeckii TaxID=1082345 RepID=A0A7W9AL92_9SPHN|nr:4,5-dihydroxyphthalate decarboxylase [Sphingobium boeckii]